MSLKKLNYIGSKHSLLDFIESTIRDKTGITDFTDKKIADVFSGTSSVGFMLRNLGCNVISNDMEYYAYVIARASVCTDYTDRIRDLLNEIKMVEGVSGIVANTYSELGEDGRMFFTIENAQKIDGMRQKLEDLKPTLTNDEYYFILASILVSADSVANTPAVYGAYLKAYKNTALEPINLVPIHQSEVDHHLENKAMNLESVSFVDQMENVDGVYLDPPYNERQYCKNYHVLNYIARYDESLEIYGVSGLIRDTVTSEWCSRPKAPKMLEDLMEKLKTKTEWVFMSYNNEGIIPHDKIREIFEKYCETQLVEKEYRRFNNFKYNKSGKTSEYIWVGKFL